MVVTNSDTLFFSTVGTWGEDSRGETVKITFKQVKRKTKHVTPKLVAAEPKRLDSQLG